MQPSERTLVAVYRRRVEASLERVWENVFDWEHLPWLHRNSFAAIEQVASGDWGWRARVRSQPDAGGAEIGIELIVDRARSRYVTRTLDGPGVGTEIWTRLERRGEQRTDIEVEFQVPDVSPEDAGALGAAYVRLYTRLWDEDESMMMRREAQLGRAPRGPGGDRLRLELGRLDELRARLPLCVDVGARRFRIVDVDGALFAHATVCPHRLGPLDASSVEAGAVRCPWHGYRFDVRSGRSCDGRGLRLDRAPRVEVDPGTSRVRLVAGG